MLHYKLTGNALNIALQNKERFPGNGKFYGDFIDLLMRKPTYRIKQNTAVKFRKASDLVQSGFLFISEHYGEYVKASAKGKALAG
jgi:hypothetical protein